MRLISQLTRAYVRLTGVAVAAAVVVSITAAAAPARAATSGISYVGRVASGTAASSSSSIALTTTRAVTAGDALLVGLLLSSTSPLTGAVSATDSAGNTYRIDRDQNDGSDGDRVLLLSALSANPMPSGGRITITFPKSAECHASVDGFSGIGALDKSASASGRTSPFGSGSVATAGANELLIGVVGNESGGNPAWSSGWTGLPTLSVSSDHLDSAYQLATAAGSYAATGTVTGVWMAAIAAYAPAGPPPEAAPVARLGVSPVSGTAPLAVTADGSGSTDGDATPIASYSFDFGDGSAAVVTTAPSATAAHTYSAAGSFTVTLRVTDTAGLVSAPVTATVTVSANTGPGVAVYAGYYDTHHDSYPQPKPSPWQGSPNTVFVGKPDGSSGGWDSSAVRIDNLTGASMAVVVTVDIGSHHFALWGTQTIPAATTLVVTQMGLATFDGSDENPAGCYGCSPTLCTTEVQSTQPVIHVTIGGQTFNYVDTGQVLNTHGVDSAGCPDTGGTRNDESEVWQRTG